MTKSAFDCGTNAFKLSCFDESIKTKTKKPKKCGGGSCVFEGGVSYKKIKNIKI